MKILRITLIVLTAFLALTAMLGGLALIANLNAPPLEQLQGSIFTSFTIPGLALFLLVGGGSLLAAILLVRKSRYATLSATAAGFLIMFFEFVEVLVIGSPAGVALTLQIFYFGLGTVIVILSLLTWFLQLQIDRSATGSPA
jgi:hypothetical protein